MILIENYRGWDISFDTEAETFIVESDEHDDKKVKKSFASAKKFVDDFIKDNANFKEFVVEKYNTYNRKKMRIVGISKDSKFVAINEDGTRTTVSKWDESDWFLPNEKNEPIKKEIAELEFKVESLKNRISILNNSLIKVTLKDLKKNY